MSKESIGERFQALVNLLSDGNQATFAKRVDLPADIVADMVAGRLARIGFRTCQRLFEHVPTLSKTWLFAGAGPMLEEAPKAEPAPKAPVPAVAPTTNVLARAGETTIPFLQAEQVGVFVSKQAVWCETIRMPNAMLPPGNVLSFPVPTDQLSPEISKGDVLICKEVVSYDWGALSPQTALLTLVEGTILVAHFEVDRLTQTIRLRSDNKAATSRSLRLDEVSQLWIVKLTFSRNSGHNAEPLEGPVPTPRVLFPEALRLARKNKKMTQAAVASALGISNTVVSHFETGTSKPSAKVLQGLAKLLEVDFTDAQF